jgi:tRNA pseudouridine55 synthase
MKRYVVLDKKIGETPLEALGIWRSLHPAYKSVKATYAGRLDPMASGKLLILLGEECKKKFAYTGLDKEYEVSVLLDISTDTGDTLGLPVYRGQAANPSSKDILEVLRNEVGTRSHQYPSYSSRTVGGIPLFLHALRGTLDSIEVPSHTESIHQIRLISCTSVASVTVAAYVEQALKTVPRDDAPTKVLGADFRQDEIRSAWRSLFHNMPERNFIVLKVRVGCGSGAYMRTLAERIGRSLGTSAVAVSIHRTKIGTHHILGPFSFFFPSL